MKIYFLLPYAERIAPSQRFRIEAYFGVLNNYGVEYTADYFWTKKANLTLYKQGKFAAKAFYLIRGFLLRTVHVITKARHAEYVVIHREAAPTGPPIFEWFIAKVLKKRIVYDFDDAIWIPNVSANNRLASSIKAFWKVRHICKWSYKISAGNAYLANWARQYNKNVVINPTTVDMRLKHNSVKDQLTQEIVIGWTGSHSTLKYLDAIVPVLQRLENEFSFQFLVICNQPPSFSLKSLHFIRWNEETEIEDLLRMNIGVMPLEEDAWSEGKCGFKLIQYLSLGIPSVASPVGVNKTIIEQGVNGYLATSDAEWYESLKQLLQDGLQRSRFGEAGRDKMWEQYSVQSNEQVFLSLFS